MAGAGNAGGFRVNAAAAPDERTHVTIFFARFDDRHSAFSAGLLLPHLIFSFSGARRPSPPAPRNFCARELSLTFPPRANGGDWILINLTEIKFMKLKMIVLLLSVAAVVFIIGGAACTHALKESAAAGDQIVAYYTCPMHPSVKSGTPGSCPECGMGLVPVYENDVATNNAPAGATNHPMAESAKTKPYPFDTCVVDGMKLGSMGDPYVFVYQGQEIKFCCAGCKQLFLEDPDKYMKKIHSHPIGNWKKLECFA
jgi:YHS domain-containing protein